MDIKSIGKRSLELREVNNHINVGRKYLRESQLVVNHVTDIDLKIGCGSENLIA